MSSKPTTLTSSGTRRPASRSAPMAPRATTSLATKTASNVVRCEQSRPSPRGRWARRSRGLAIELSGRRSMPAAARACAIALEPFLGRGVDERGVGDAGDPRWPSDEQVLDGAARAGDVVDVDAGHVEARQGALEDDREARRGRAPRATGRRCADRR